MDGPLFANVSVHVRLVPATTGSGASLFELRSATDSIVRLASARLLDATGSGVSLRTVATLFTSWPSLDVIAYEIVARPD